MKLKEIFQEKKVVLSFECFPPKKDGDAQTVYSALDALSELQPDFISVTCGAGGSENRNATGEIAARIKAKYAIAPVAHVTCVNSAKEDLQHSIAQFRRDGIENIMALRGDKTPDWKPGALAYASDLVTLLKQEGGFHILAACYPEGHAESPTQQGDLERLKEKVDCGVDSLITQMFFDNDSFYDFRDKAARQGIHVPIQAGIMPVLNKNQILRMVSMCGASLPKKFVKIINRYESDPQSLFDAGIFYATEQIIDLISSEVRGMHLYVMNRPQVAQRLCDNLRGIIGAVNGRVCREGEPG